MEYDSQINGKPLLPEALNLLEKLLRAIFSNGVSHIHVELLKGNVASGREQRSTQVMLVLPKHLVWSLLCTLCGPRKKGNSFLVNVHFANLGVL